MENRFVAVDVETANPDLASICQVGVVSFQKGKITNAWSTLVDPEAEFARINVAIHGIDERSVAHAPKFSDIANKLAEIFADNVVVSHTPFDRVALGKANKRCRLPGLVCTWLDTARVARRVWPQFARRGYGLANVAEHCGITFRHHDAAEDARAAGLILLCALAESGTTLEDWVVRIMMPLSGISSSAVDPNGPLAGEVVVFTGQLSILREDAARLAVAASGEVAKTVTKKVTLLVVGDQDICKLAGHNKSSKHRKAEALICKGQTIMILQESDFCALVSPTN